MGQRVPALRLGTDSWKLATRLCGKLIADGGRTWRGSAVKIAERVGYDNTPRFRRDGSHRASAAQEAAYGVIRALTAEDLVYREDSSDLAVVNLADLAAWLADELEEAEPLASVTTGRLLPVGLSVGSRRWHLAIRLCGRLIAGNGGCLEHKLYNIARDVGLSGTRGARADGTSRGSKADYALDHVLLVLEELDLAQRNSGGVAAKNLADVAGWVADQLDAAGRPSDQCPPSEMEEPT